MKMTMIKLVLTAFLAVGISATQGIASSETHSGGTEAIHAEAAPAHGETVEVGHDAVSSHEASAGHETAAVEHGTEAGAHGGAHGGSSLTPKKLKDLFLRTVNFLLLAIGLIYFLAKPIKNGLDNRRKQIKEELENLQLKRDEAERTYREFESRLSGMEKEMETIVEKAIALAQTEKVRILEEAEKAADDIRKQAQAAIQAEIVEAKRKLLDDAADHAAAMAEQMIVNNLTASDQVNITEQYLTRVGAVQ
ncbi:MAG: ATP synthase F0 subunit B [Desulfobulbaceae bacterium]|nr:ATP synthase F0 subunit B [Desulfobulbaceae bacterium]